MSSTYYLIKILILLPRGWRRRLAMWCIHRSCWGRTHARRPRRRHLRRHVDLSACDENMMECVSAGRVVDVGVRVPVKVVKMA